MPVRRRELEVSVERPLGSPEDGEGVVRLTAKLESPDGSAPSPAELEAAVSELRRELTSVLGPPVRTGAAPRPDRSLAELIGTYRPRQHELIDLLRDEGEISPGEHALLSAALPGPSRAATPPPAPSPPARASLAAPPEPPVAVVPAERGLPAARAVPELLRLYQITSLRQAGAVRARRQISFAEYMALKRHFESSEPTA